MCLLVIQPRFAKPFFLDLGAPPEFVKETSVRLAESHGSIAENLRRHGFEKGRGVGIMNRLYC